MNLARLNRALTVAALTALAVTVGIWLNRSPMTAAAPPGAEIVPEPALAPSPVPAPPAVPAITIEVPVEMDIAARAPILADAPSAEPHQPDERTPQPQPICGFISRPRHWGRFWRR